MTTLITLAAVSIIHDGTQYGWTHGIVSLSHQTEVFVEYETGFTRTFFVETDVPLRAFIDLVHMVERSTTGQTPKITGLTVAR
jgi:hypothetical protein